MKKIAFLAAVTAGVTALSSVAVAEEGTVRMRAGLAAVSYVAPDDDPDTEDMKSSYGAVNVGGSYVASNGLFVDLGLRQSLSAEWNAKDSFGASKDDDFDRREITLSVGKSLGDGVSVFGGIQLAENEFKASEPFFLSGVNMTITTDSTLFFAGASKALQLGSGTLSLSGALGLMRQELEIEAAGPGGSASSKEKSDTGVGVSLGAAYGFPIAQNLSILADLRFQSYQVKYGGESSQESVTSLGASIVGQF